MPRLVPNKPTPSVLRRWYVERGLSAAEIAGRVGCAPSTVLLWLRESKIKPRGPGLSGLSVAERQKRGRETTARRAQESPLADHQVEIVRLYRRERRSIREIAARFGVSYQAVRFQLRFLGVRLRCRGARGMRPDVMRRNIARARDESSEARSLPPDRDVLVKAYERDGKSIAEIAEECGVAYSSARRWLVKAGIPRRPVGGSRKRPEQLDRPASALTELLRCPVCTATSEGVDTEAAFEALADHIARWHGRTRQQAEELASRAVIEGAA